MQSIETDTEIYFYGVKNHHGYMSNFFKTKFVDTDGTEYNCSEQYFMVQKCKLFDPDNAELLQAILSETSPAQIKKYGRQVRNYDDNVWKTVREVAMLEAVRLKFRQNKGLKEKLLATRPKTLYEASKHDRIWGIGFCAEHAVKEKDKSQFGDNLLGKALMSIRDELSESG